MATRERPADRGRRAGRHALFAIGSEIRAARVDRGLSCGDVARAAKCSASTVSRVERGLNAAVPVVALAELAAIVGLDLSVRTYAGPQPLRDAGHTALLASFAARLHRVLRWATEVPLPAPGDQRAWDAMVLGETWRYGVEAETAPRDAQALNRRLQIKRRDSDVDGILLVLPATRRVREFLAAADPVLRSDFPVPGSRALELLAAGADPRGSAVIVLPVGSPVARGAHK